MPFVSQLGNPTALINFELVAATEIDVAGCTIICKLPTSILQSIGNFLQIQLVGSSVDSLFNGVYHSYCATSGSAYNADTTPTPYAYEGSLTFTLPTAGILDTDVLSFAQLIKPTLIAFNAGATCKALAAYVPGAVSYIASAVQDADDATRVGTYTEYKDTVFFMQSIMVSP
jgi:hypothetical protein